MNEAIAFDTLRFARHLTETGFAAQQAVALADEIRDILEKLATKDDLARVEVALKADLKVALANTVTKDDFHSALEKLATKDDLARVEVAFRADLTNLATKADLRADIAQAKYEITRWVVGVGFGVTTLIIGFLSWLFHGG